MTKNDSNERDEVLKPMLKMPPKPHKPPAPRLDGKVSKKTKKRGK